MSTVESGAVILVHLGHYHMYVCAICLAVPGC